MTHCNLQSWQSIKCCIIRKATIHITLKKMGKSDNSTSLNGVFLQTLVNYNSAKILIVRENDKNDPVQHMEVFSNQVAGHRFASIGLIKYNDKVIKPVKNPVNFQREIRFYEDLKLNPKNFDQIMCLIPKFYGTVRVPLDTNGTVYDAMVLEDCTMGFWEPCVMDVKIGYRTWDLEATPEKIEKEKMKYSACKRDLQFCIPGFQVYNVRTAQLQRFDSEYGKQLNQSSAIQAIKTYLNCDEGEGNVINRELIMNLLTDLWRIQNWARHQHHLVLYSSSVLFVYDASILRTLTTDDNTTCHKNWGIWAKVKMIDFAHVFQSNGLPDDNYTMGINSLVSVFEDFLTTH